MIKTDTSEPEIWPFKNLCLNYPPCNSACVITVDNLSDCVQLPLELQQALDYFLDIRSSAPQDLQTHFDVQHWWNNPLVHVKNEKIAANV